MNTDDLGAFLYDNWGLLYIKKELLNGYGSNFNILIHTKFGKYVLRASRNGRSGLIQELNFEDILIENKIPVRKTLYDSRGNSIVEQESECLNLGIYIYGIPFTMNSMVEIREAASMLAKLHSIKYASELDMFTSVHDPYHWLVNPTFEINRIKSARINIQLKKALIDNLEKILNQMDLQEYLKCPRAIVHGDYHGNNLIYDRARLNGIIDLETMGISAKAVDIAEACFLLGRNAHKEYIFNADIMYEFLDTYLANNSITEVEIKNLANILKLRFLPRASYLDRIAVIGVERVVDHVTWALRAVAAVDNWNKFIGTFWDKMDIR